MLKTRSSVESAVGVGQPVKVGARRRKPTRGRCTEDTDIEKGNWVSASYGASNEGEYKGALSAGGGGHLVARGLPTKMLPGFLLRILLRLRTDEAVHAKTQHKKEV